MTQCPQCHHLNPSGARFCAGCGVELARQCNACGKTVPPDARFCPHCGAVIVSEPPVPWLDRRLTPQVRQALYALARGLAAVLLIMAFVTAILTPPPLIFDETILLVAGAAMLVAAEVVKPRRKPKPPDEGDLQVPEPPPTDGIENVPPDEIIEETEALSHYDLPPAGRQGPHLN